MVIYSTKGFDVAAGMVLRRHSALDLYTSVLSVQAGSEFFT